MRVIAFRCPQNPSPLPDLGAYAQTHLCLPLLATLLASPILLDRSGRREVHDPCHSPQFRWCNCSRVVDFSWWGRCVRGVPVCHTRSICPSCDTLPFPCHWWLSTPLLRYP